MNLEPVKSKAVAAIGYDAETKELQVRFTSGGLYSYPGVTGAQYLDLMAAKSKGRAVYALGKGKGKRL